MQTTSHSKALTNAALALRISLPGQWLPFGWVAPDGMTYNEWSGCASGLGIMISATHMWVGDWLNEGERRYGEKYAQAMDDTGLPYDTLARDAYVTRRVPFWLRLQIYEETERLLSFSHYQAVAPLATEAERAHWLTLAARGNGHGRWSVRELKEQMRQAQPDALPEPDPPPEPPAPAPITTPDEYEAARAVLDRGAPKPERREVLEAVVETWEAATVAAQEPGGDVDARAVTCPECGYRWWE